MKSYKDFSNSCKICIHKDKNHIEELMKSKSVIKDIIKEYPELTYQNISNHAVHMQNKNIPGRIQELIDEALDSKLKPKNTTEVMSLIKYNERHQDEIEKSEIQYKKQDLGLAIAEYLRSNIKSETISKVAIDFELFKKEFKFTNRIRSCENCLICIVKPGDYFKCHGRELGCQGQGNATINNGAEDKVLENEK